MNIEELFDTLETIEALETNRLAAEERAIALNNIFHEFGLSAKCTGYEIGPSVTRFNIELSSKTSVRDFSKYVEDFGIRLGCVEVRFEPLVEGKNYSGLEFPNPRSQVVSFKELFGRLPKVEKHPLAIGLGQNIDGKIISIDLDEAPHCLVAGTTGSGKSIFLHSLINTLVLRNSPEQLRLVLFDPKRMEFNKYKELPHLLCPIAHDSDKGHALLEKLVDEMNARYELLAEAGVSNIKQYNEVTKKKLPYIVIIIDEYADLVDSHKEFSTPIIALAQKARAAGIHMIISTQRPATNIVTGVLKGNLPTRIALSVASAIDSVTMIGECGAEKLLGRGDMLVQSPLVSKNGLIRLQACYVQNKEVSRIVNYLKEQYNCSFDERFMDLKVEVKPEPQKEIDDEEEKYQTIKEWVMTCDYMSMSRIQRECSVGFNRAGRYFKRLMEEGIVSKEATGNKGYKVLIHDALLDEVAEEEIEAVLNDKTLLIEAKNARGMSYSPYSHFAVGAAVLTDDGKIFRGANIENSSYPLCMCAERNALYNAYCHGYTKNRLVMLALCADTDEPCSPCGACRQVIHELFPEDAPILLSNLKGDIKATNAKELLPFAFTEKVLKK